MFFAYFLIGLRLCHRTFLFLFRYDVQWYQRRGGTFAFSLSFYYLLFSSISPIFFSYLLLSFLEFLLSSIFFFTFYYFIFPQRKPTTLVEGCYSDTGMFLCFIFMVTVAL